MTCRELRRAFLVAPPAVTDAMRQHLGLCAPCRGFAASVQALDERLRAALTVPVGQEVAAGTLLMARVLTERQRARRHWMISAGAAAAAAAISVVLPRASAPDLTEDVLSHVKPPTFGGGQEVSVHDLAHVLARIDERASRPLNGVIYAANCRILGATAAHLVFSDRGALVNVFLMPRVPVGQARDVRIESWSGRIAPFGAGSMALLATRQDSIAAVEDRLRLSFAVDTD